MRRVDREVTDLDEILKIVSQCDVIRLGLVDEGIPYIVPLNFAFKKHHNEVTFVFHSAAEGRKIDIAKKNPYACFELDCSFKITPNEIPCKWSAEHESVIGYGHINFIQDEAEKKAAMDLIMQKYGFNGTPEYTPSMFANTVLYKLTAEEIIGKRNIK